MHPLFRHPLSRQLGSMTADTPKGAAYGQRVEDERLLRGNGRFMDDGVPEGRAYAAFVRSPHAFARIAGMSTDEARGAPGVLAVLAAVEMKAAGAEAISRHPPMTGRGGAKIVQTDRPALAGDRVMHVGEPVAAVIAETINQALDAADLIVVDYQPLD